MANFPAPAALAAFIANLHNERDTMRSFVSLLEKEQQTLLEGDAEQLLPLADNKTRMVARLNELGVTRKQFQTAHDAQDNLINWLKVHAAKELPIWEEIRSLAARAQHLNHTNGEMINTKLRHNQQALSVLHNAANTTTSLYGRDGQPNLPGSGRKLGSV